MPNWCSNKLDISGSVQELEQIEKLMLNSDGVLDFNIAVPQPKALEGVYTNTWEGEMVILDHNPNRIGKLTPSAFLDRLTTLHEEHGHEAFLSTNIETLVAECPFIASDKPVESSIVSAVNAWRSLPEEGQDNSPSPEQDKVVVFMLEAMKQENNEHCNKVCGYTDWYEWSCHNWGTKWNTRTTKEDRSEKPGGLVFHFDTAWGPADEWFYSLVNEFNEIMPDNKAEFLLSYAEPNMWFGGSINVQGGGSFQVDAYSDEQLSEFLGIEMEDDEEQD